MSLINQMLRDLEHRRSADAGPSPLGGLSSSGSAIQAINFSVNYRTLAAMVALLFVAGLLVAYALGGQQQRVENKSVLTQGAENKFLEPVKSPLPGVVAVAPVDIAPEPQEIVETVSKAIVVETVNTTAEKTVSSLEVVAEETGLMVVEPAATDDESVAIEAAEPGRNQDINKTIRPLTDEQQSQLAFQRAIKLLGSGNQLAAQVALEESLQIAPNHLRSRETLAAILLNDGRVSEAAGSLRDGLQLMPDATPLAKLYARILVDQGDAVEAIAVLERARPAVSADPEYHALLAALYRQEKKHAQAVYTYQQVLMQRPGMATYWMGLALSQDAMGEKTQALEAFQRAQRAGGLGAEVLRYIQSRIEVLMPVEPAPANNTSNDADEFEE